ncbi:GCS-domain-containing protein [Violaceomyces palustris]|uniref:GCS-domain-containing protein n=1 Tax=Violaceomyces palustris TaxID=1673888 RepID=A0ACD0P570_9BASI|nr:GCS-domain-containing protein [Violaceomyces palustris]
MGLLSLGTPLDWPQARPLASHVREHGITQFLHLWNKIKDRRGDKLLWGDEIEYMVITLDDQQRSAKLSLRQEEILKVLSQSSSEHADHDPDRHHPDLAGHPPTFHPEFGRFMLESTPGSPYGASPNELKRVEGNMRLRRKIARSHLRPDELPITLTSFPRLGVNDAPFTEPHFEPRGEASRSMFLPDQIINPHARFPTLAANIRKRRGSKVAINVPIFKDERTPSPFIDPSVPWDRDLFPEDGEAKAGAALQDHIYMDAMGFGMGCCCLQVTFQACSVQEARTVYDQLTPVAPIMLALTAASPAYRGYLSDVDCRWNVISGAVDDRTPEERGEKPLDLAGHTPSGGLDHASRRVPKSRYDSVDSYLSLDPANRKEYNDNPLPVNEAIRERLMSEGVDKVLADHLSHLFIRDPIVIFSEMIDQDDESSTDHFENIQSTNWQTMRFKPPPPGGAIGWRVEFRSMEVQITDFENAAFSVFIVLLTRAILSFGLNFYMPISKVDENMKRAQERDSVGRQKFHFRKEVFRKRNRHRVLSRNPSFDAGRNGGGEAGSGAEVAALGSDSGLLDRHSPPSSGRATPIRNHLHHHPSSSSLNGTKILNGKGGRSSSTPGSPRAWNGSGTLSPHQLQVPVEEEYEEMSMDEIINGKGDEFPGLLGLVRNYLDSLNIDVETRCTMGLYLDLVGSRANGSLMTTATWIRNYVRSHPEYNFDSVISQGINYDMIKKLDLIERGLEEAPGFLPSIYAKRRRDEDR